MAINPKTTGVHHVNLRCSNLASSKAFYQNVIGFPIPLETPELFAFPVGPVFIVFKQAEESTPFNPMRIGMDHLAMACDSVDELQRVAKGLSDAGIENTGVKTDPTLQKQYVAFKDPDRIQWEFYMV
jgi:glyoxylase I family protein